MPLSFEAQALQRLTAIEGKVTETTEDVKEVRYRLEGNGSPGLLRDVDRLKESEVRRSRLLWIILSAVLLLGVNAMWDRLFERPVVQPVLGPLPEPRK
jgi:hypothetical protein